MRSSPHTVMHTTSVLYMGCRRNASPEAKPDLKWVTPMLAILALRCKMFTVQALVQVTGNWHIPRNRSTLGWDGASASQEGIVRICRLIRMQWCGSSLTGGCSRVVTKRKRLFDREGGVGWNGWQRNIEDFVDNGV